MDLIAIEYINGNEGSCETTYRFGVEQGPFASLFHGRKIWKNAKGEIHNDGDRPAIICLDGTYYYCKNGKYHRDDNLPAIIYSDGYCKWFIDGKLIKEQFCSSEKIEMFKLPYDGK